MAGPPTRLNADTRQSGECGRGTVLVVDDSEDCRIIYSAALAFAGYAVLTAGDGAEGVRLAADAVPDLVLMDIEMPVLDGFNALRLLRAREPTRNITIVALTARASLHQQSELKSAGFDDVLLKPITPMRVVEAVERRMPKQSS
jgi:CheY-like chemotaxis protein